ncbi:Nup54 domain-containing protein, partial [Pseudozyma hubeiensis]
PTLDGKPSAASDSAADLFCRAMLCWLGTAALSITLLVACAPAIIRRALDITGDLCDPFSGMPVVVGSDQSDSSGRMPPPSPFSLLAEVLFRLTYPLPKRQSSIHASTTLAQLTDGVNTKKNGECVLYRIRARGSDLQSRQTGRQSGDGQFGGIMQILIHQMRSNVRGDNFKPPLEKRRSAGCSDGAVKDELAKTEILFQKSSCHALNVRLKTRLAFDACKHGGDEQGVACVVQQSTYDHVCVRVIGKLGARKVIKMVGNMPNVIEV